jgi:hypothetical protein
MSPQQGYDTAGKSFKVHLDGYDQGDLRSGNGPTKRREFFYWTDDGNLAGLRYDKWKIGFLEQRAEGLDVWREPLIALRAPLVFDLRTDPFERAQHEAGDYQRWYVEHVFLMAPAVTIVGRHLQSFKDFPPRQRPGTFSIDQAMQALTRGLDSIIDSPTRRGQPHRNLRTDESRRTAFQQLESSRRRVRRSQRLRWRDFSETAAPQLVAGDDTCCFAMSG